MIKSSPSDADEAALVSLTITDSPSGSGQVSDNGAGDGSGQLDFMIGNDALSSVTDFDKTYFGIVKVILSNSMINTVSQYPVKILKAGIQALS